MNHEAERAWDRALNIHTEGIEYWQETKYMPYEPTPYPVLKRLADSGLITSIDHVLDYGCGKGRAAFFLSAYTGCRVTGIDRSEKLISIAEANRAGFIHPDRVRFLVQNAELYRPAEENTFYFFNPFSETVLDIVLRRILPQLVEGSRTKLIFYYPSDAYLSRLASEPEISIVHEIDCRNISGRNDPREKITVFMNS